MKNYVGSAILAGAVILTACKEPSNASAAESVITLESEEQRISYAMGLTLGEQFRRDGIELDSKVFSSGIAHALADSGKLMNEEEIQKTMMAFQQAQQAKMQAAANVAAEENKVTGEAFLAENGKLEGVITTESGLQYKVITAGEGKKPSAEDTVSVHYRGTLIDGTEFDSSHKRGAPAEFPVNRVIPGWTEALQLMPAGSKWELTIPSDLAYGLGGTGREIGPNATLKFEVELLEIK